MDSWKRIFLLKTIIFKGYVGSRECTPVKKSKKLPRLDGDFSSRQAKKNIPEERIAPQTKRREHEFMPEHVLESICL